MSFRIEEKLRIDKNRLIDFKIFLSNKTAKQIYEPRKIQSLYFDNENYQMYKDSLEGLTPRKKIRVRSYPGSNDKKLYLETKISSVEGRFKTRKILDINNFNDLKTKGILDAQYGLCKPILYVKYSREYLKIKDVRVSLDTDIKYTLFSGRNLGEDENLIVELKTSINKDVDELVCEFPLQRTRFSKYCNGIEKI